MGNTAKATLGALGAIILTGAVVAGTTMLTGEGDAATPEHSLLVHQQTGEVFQVVSTDVKIGTASNGQWIDDDGETIGKIPSLSAHQQPEEGKRYMLTTGLVPCLLPTGSMVVDNPVAVTSYRQMQADQERAAMDYADQLEDMKDQLAADALHAQGIDPPAEAKKLYLDKGKITDKKPTAVAID